jgi:hypothetical protein
MTLRSEACESGREMGRRDQRGVDPVRLSIFAVWRPEQKGSDWAVTTSTLDATRARSTSLFPCIVVLMRGRVA